MKKKLISFMALMLASAMLLCSLSSCSGGKKAVSYGSQSLSDAIYQYLCCVEKTNYLYKIYGTTADKTPASNLDDNENVWKMQSDDGSTLADELRKTVLNKMKTTVYFAEYAKQLGYKINDELKSQMGAQLDQIASQFANKKAFNDTVGAYGVNYNILYDYYLIDGLASLGIYSLFGEKGSMKITNDEALANYKKNYSTIEFIYINDKNKTYPNGKTVYLPDEEKEVKKKLASEIMDEIKSGSDFSKLANQFSEKKIDDSTVCTFTDNGFAESTVEAKVKTMKKDDVEMIATDNGIFIIKKLATDESFFNDNSAVIIANLEAEKKAQIVEKNAQGFTIDEDLINSIDIASLPHAQ